eukprot:1159218-Pelagomonas_calceolata.AAC.4
MGMPKSEGRMRSRLVSCVQGKEDEETILRCQSLLCPSLPCAVCAKCKRSECKRCARGGEHACSVQVHMEFCIYGHVQEKQVGKEAAGCRACQDNCMHDGQSMRSAYRCRHLQEVKCSPSPKWSMNRMPAFPEVAV